MGASCAACLRPIQPGAKFALAGTEVFHRECARSIASSIGTRQKLEIVRLRGQLASEQQEAARLRVAITDTHQAGERRLDEVKGRQLMSNLQNAEARRRRDESVAETESLRYEVRLIAKQRDDAKLDAAAARTELALMQTLSGARTTAPAPVTTTPQAPDPPKDELDDSEQRFALLELDPLE